MEINYEHIGKKILDFWNKYDGVDLDAATIKQYFTPDEIYIILDNINFKENYYRIAKDFSEKIRKLDNLFSPEEAKVLAQNHADVDYKVLESLDDNSLLSIISMIIENKDYEDYYNKEHIIQLLSSDEAKIKAFEIVVDGDDKIEIVKNFNSDELKIQYLKKIPDNQQGLIIQSFKSEELKEKYLTFFTKFKGKIIKSFSDDEKKAFYLKKYYLSLENYEKADIIVSMQSDEQILYHLSSVNDKVRRFFIERSSQHEHLFEKIIDMIKKKSVLAEVLQSHNIDDNIVLKYADQIDDQKELFGIVRNFISDENKVKYLFKLNDQEKLSVISSMESISSVLKSYKYLNNKSLIFSRIVHIDSFPEYSTEYEYLIDLYSEKYKLNKNHLLFLVENVSLSILKVVTSENIQRIINAPEQQFQIISSLFNKNTIKMDAASINDILNSLLQRKFRYDSGEVVLIFPTIMGAINNSDKPKILESLNMIAKNIDINSELAKKNWSLEEFVGRLLTKDQEAIDFLHNISTKYIVLKRNEYVQNNLGSSLEKCTITSYEKNDLMKYLMSTYPIELLMSYFPKPKNVEKELWGIYFPMYTEDELKLLMNQDLLKEIILYKKNPGNYAQIPDEIKKNIRTFNEIFNKIFEKNDIKDFPNNVNAKKKYTLRNTNPDTLINIMIELDISKMDIDLFNNPEIMNTLIKTWQQYKLCAWDNSIVNFAIEAGITADPEIMASFIQYFGLSYKILDEKIKNGQISNITLTAMLDLAESYSAVSKKYKLLFGEEDFRYLAVNPAPNSSSLRKQERLDKAVNIIRDLHYKEKATIPTMDKNFKLKCKKDINIVVGNYSNIMNITYGERTGSCMRIGGAGEKLFNFCAKNDNGFHIRFTNPTTGKFVSRVSGFRNGNTVFLNELRLSEDSNYSNEDIVEACQLISKEIVELSKDSEYPIDNVVISPHYAMVFSKMKTTNLQISDPRVGLGDIYTDVTADSIILATSLPNNEFTPFKPGTHGIPKYPVVRDKQQTLYGEEAAIHAAHLQCLDQVLSKKDIYDVDVTVNEEITVCIAGEDWYIAVDKTGNMEKFIMHNTRNKQQAIDEMQQALAYLKYNLEQELTISETRSLGM